MTIDLANLINPARKHITYAGDVHGVTDAAGNRWSVVTDGHSLVAVQDGQERTTFPHEKVLLAQLEHWPEPQTIEASRIFAWLEGVDGSMPIEKECTECKGKKRFECECERCGLPHDAACGNCESTGKVCDDDLSDSGTIRGRHFNRRFFKRALACIAPDPTASLTLSIGAKDGDALRLSGEGWIFAIMPRRDAIEGAAPELLP
jgi:hypothetical protein